MDLSPCRIVKMELHSRIGTGKVEIVQKSYFNEKSLPPLFKRSYQSCRKNRVESYRASSQVYQKLNAKIHIGNIELKGKWKYLDSIGSTRRYLETSADKTNLGNVPKVHK